MVAKKPAAAKPAKDEKTTAIEKAELAQKTPAKEGKVKAFRSKYKLEDVITLLVDYNPKRAGSAAYASFEYYQDGMNVGEFLGDGGAQISLGWDVEHGFIKIDTEFDQNVEKKSKPVKEKTAPKAKKEVADDADDADEED